MSVRALETLHTRARWTVALLIALLVGVGGGTWAATSAQRPSVNVSTVADEGPGGAGQTGKPDQTAKPEKTATTDAQGPGASAAQGAHGACVSAVAKDEALVGGRNNNHGGAVSAAAHSCPRGNAGHARGQSADAPGQDKRP